MNSAITVKRMISNKNGILMLVFCLGVTVRMYFFPIGLPVSLDGIDYFSFAYSLSENGEFPKGILGTNDGWAILLGALFKIVNTHDFQILQFIQRFAKIGRAHV